MKTLFAVLALCMADVAAVRVGDETAPKFEGGRGGPNDKPLPPLPPATVGAGAVVTPPVGHAPLVRTASISSELISDVCADGVGSDMRIDAPELCDDEKIDGEFGGPTQGLRRSRSYSQSAKGQALQQSFQRAMININYIAHNLVERFQESEFFGSQRDGALRDGYNLVLDTLWIKWGIQAAEYATSTGDWADVALTSFQIRNIIKEMVQQLSSGGAQFYIKLRQSMKYGSSHGPASFEKLVQKKGSHEEVFYSGFASDGGDMGLTAAFMNNIKACSRALGWQSGGDNTWAPTKVWQCGMQGNACMETDNAFHVVTGQDSFWKDTRKKPCLDFRAQLCQGCEGTSTVEQRNCGKWPKDCPQ